MKLSDFIENGKMSHDGIILLEKLIDEVDEFQKIRNDLNDKLQSAFAYIYEYNCSGYINDRIFRFFSKEELGEYIKLICTQSSAIDLYRLKKAVKEYNDLPWIVRIFKRVKVVE